MDKNEDQTFEEFANANTWDIDKDGEIWQREYSSRGWTVPVEIQKRSERDYHPFVKSNHCDENECGRKTLDEAKKGRVGLRQESNCLDRSELQPW